MVTKEQIEIAAREVAESLGYVLMLVGTRFNGSGLTTFLWHFEKDGKTHVMQDEVNLRAVGEAQLTQWSFVFRSDMAAMEEIV